MKKISIFVLGIVVGLVGFAIAGDKLPGRTAASKGGMHSGDKVSVTQLTPEQEKVLGLKEEEALLTILDLGGRVRILHPSGYKVETGHGEFRTDHPVTVHSIEPMSLLTFSGSPKCAWMQIGGNWIQVCR